MATFSAAVVLMSVQAFLNTIGVNIHAEYTDTAYANAYETIADLKYLGITHVRDAVLNPANQGQWNYPVIAQAGIDFDFVVPGGSDLPSTFNLVEQFAAAYPGSVRAIEGPNEINNWPFAYEGLTGQAAATAFQNAIYTTVTSESALAGTAVFDFTGGTGQTLAQQAAYANIHPYAYNGLQDYSFIGSNLENAYGTTNPGPYVITESGYETANTPSGVSQDAQSKLTLNLLFDAAANGATATYLYELLDELPDPKNKLDADHFGLFANNGSPKTSAVSIHNLTTFLSNGASSPVSPTPTPPPTYTITGLPSTARMFVLNKANGVYDFILYNDVQIWNSVTQRSIAIPNVVTAITFGTNYRSATVVYPTLKVANATFANLRTVHCYVSANPVIIEVSVAAASSKAGN